MTQADNKTVFGINQYQKEAEATKSPNFFPPGLHGDSLSMPTDILHAIVGLSTEAGEMLGAAKKNMFYGAPIDYVNLDEEIGDMMWYIAIYCNARGKDIEQICKTNNAKLTARYPNKFTQFHALNRNLDSERKILEDGNN